MTSKIRLIIFDLDGTLIDTMGSFADIAGELLAKFYDLSFEEGRKRYLETSGIPFFQQMEILFPQNQKNKTTVELFERMKVSSFMNESISEKTLEILHALRDREIRTAISSNNFHSLVREFVHRENVPVDLALGYKPNFSKGRPHFEYIREYFGIPFENVLFVGDSLSDAQRASENRIQFIAKIGTFGECDFKKLENDTQYMASIYEIYEILDILEVS
jgi:phosphoglycolate phosphatase-like HAD superfamily hydrolase